MKIMPLVSLLILLILSTSATSVSDYSANGQRLLDANCVEFHDTSMFTRNYWVFVFLSVLKKGQISCSHMSN